MSSRPLRSNLWILAPIVALSAAQACSSSSDGTKGAAGAPSAGQGGQGGASASAGLGGGPAHAGSAGSATTPNGGTDEGGAAGNSAGGGDDTAGAPSAGSGGSGAGGTTNGGAGESSAAGEAGDTSSPGGAPSGGTAGANAGGTSSGGAGGASSCIKAVKDDYVVRTDGAVLVEQRDTTKETAVLNASGTPLTGAVDAAVGTYHGCALMSDGTVQCWRETAARGNWAGQLGIGTIDQDAAAKIEQASQVLVDVGTPLTGVTALTRGGPGLQSTCAVTSSHQLYCWGDVAWLVNNGTASSSPYAQAITTNGITPLAGVVQASAGANMACAIVKNGASNELDCWGRNDYHNLATGDTTKRQYPTKVASLTSPSLVQVVDYAYALSGGGTVCAVDGGKLLCWGANAEGQTGTNTSGADVTTPTAVVIQDGTTPLPAPVDLSGIANTFCALASNKTVWCWGSYFNAAAGNYGATNISLLGGPVAGSSNLLWLFYATTDGQFHWGKEWARSPNCGAL